MSRIAVVLVNCGEYAQRYLDACYRSLTGQRGIEPPALFIVNNGADEAGRRAVRQLAPGARVLDLPDNRGWGAGNNVAIRAALADGATYVVLLNMDTVVDERWLASLVDAADHQPEAHLFQSKILLYGTRTINSVGSRIQCLGYASCSGFGQPDRPGWPTELDAASGASMLIKREVFKRIGLFREDFFLYYDDVEFCWRARLAGLRVRLVEQSVCFHHYDATRVRRFLYHIERNRLLTVCSLQRMPTLALLGPALASAELLLLVFCALTGQGAAGWCLLRELLRLSTWRGIAQRRRTIHRCRRLRDAELIRHYPATICTIAVDSPFLRWVANPLLALYWAFVRALIFW